MCVCMYLCMHVCMYACMYVCMYACMYLRMYVCKCVKYLCMYVCKYESMYVSMYVYISCQLFPYSSVVLMFALFSCTHEKHAHAQTYLFSSHKDSTRPGPANVCMCVCMHECMYACMYVYVCMHICVYHTYVCIYVSMYVCVCVCTYVSMCKQKRTYRDYNSSIQAGRRCWVRNHASILYIHTYIHTRTQTCTYILCVSSIDQDIKSIRYIYTHA